MAFNLQKNLQSLLALSNRNYIFTGLKTIFQIPTSNMTIITFICWNTFIISNFLEPVIY